MCYVHTTPLTCTSGNKQSATETAILAAILLECQVVCHELQFMAYNFSAFAFTAMTLLVGWQEGDTACKNWVVRYWHGYLSVARCKWFAYGPADVTATASFFCASKIQNGLPFWCWLTQVVLEKRPFNGCGVVSHELQDNDTASSEFSYTPENSCQSGGLLRMEVDNILQ